jgi:hypothetical protein
LNFALTPPPQPLCRPQRGLIASIVPRHPRLLPAAVPFRERFEHMADEVLNESQCEATTSAIGQLLMGNYDKISA